MHDRSALLQKMKKQMSGIPIGVTLFNMQMQRKHSQTSKSRRSWEIVRLKLPLADTQTKAQVEPSLLCVPAIYFCEIQGHLLEPCSPPRTSKISLSFYMFTALKSSTPPLQLLSCDPVQLDPFQKTQSVSASENESCLIMSCLVGFPSRCALSCLPRQFIFHIDFSLLRNRETFQVSLECL